MTLLNFWRHFSVRQLLLFFFFSPLQREVIQLYVGQAGVQVRDMKGRKSQVLLFVHQIFTTSSILLRFVFPFSLPSPQKLIWLFAAHLPAYTFERTHLSCSVQTMFYFMTDRKRLLGIVLFGAWNWSWWDHVPGQQPRQRLECFLQQLLLLFWAEDEVRSASCFGGSRANSHRRDTDGLLSFAVRSVHFDNRKRRRRKQLRARLQQPGLRVNWSDARESEEGCRKLWLFTRIHLVSFDWRRHWQWFWWDSQPLVKHFENQFSLQEHYCKRKSTKSSAKPAATSSPFSLRQSKVHVSRNHESRLNGAFIVFRISPIIVEPYNALLSTHYSMDYANCCILLDNEA